MRRFLLLGLAWSVAACAASRPAESPPSDSVPLAAAPAESSGEAPPYRLQVGDQVDVQFYKTPELNARVRVRPDGKISLQLLDDVTVVGDTPEELDARLTELYSAELREPRITVAVAAYGSARVYVGGEVDAPGMLPLDGKLTAFQAVQQAGGFLETAAPAAVLLIRRTPEGKAVGTELDLEAFVRGEKLDGDVELQAQDVVFVPRSRIADVNRFVDMYIRKNLPVTPNFGMGLGTF